MTTATKTGTTTIREVSSRRDLKQFIEYPYKLYKGDPHFVPELLISEWEKFNPKKNPFYRHARVEPFLAERNGQLVGRVAGIDDDNHNAAHHDNLAFFGFFEAADAEAAAALFEHVEAWARNLGRSILRGPANPSMNDGSGFQLDAFDTEPYIMMPQNPAQYPQYAEVAGYRKVKDLYGWIVSDEMPISERFERIVKWAKRRHKPLVRPADLKQFDREVSILKKVYNEAWEDNWGFVKYTDAEFDHLAADLKLIADPNIVLICEVKGEVAGLALGLPDVNQVFHQIKSGRLLPFGILKLLNRKRFINRMRLPILGLMPEYRGSGLELVMIDEMRRRAPAHGYHRAECSWILEDNESMNQGIREAGGELYKTYRLYQKDLF
jgi:GNAT superfamily N-acetyltransferase